ncbi:hypothetical protein G6F57_016970 [Rhizopus arrhizus]|uniref:Endonuclease/exonuclease/phosphatase domain-containing protein n=1 Tax=Rhizopus oryzae TaxID=64495 RepID=A0A9P7BKR8_RHIOR|nr:hypothetical protein G6F24_013907 [Rhizopus arrhizus]KAG0777725.1 hypothetical protein G6F21_013254 [Rhizopus arrhizus]KAG0803699.1 hypothetical protein G6F20_013293 [Rhizopus arrhizus]KAG0811492.1 hypothetical protein G6F19_013428 [Rhizopus arrhizus]KAG0812013.1 hypothetical protein G6F18_013449 [Rhizopus arrhizus]
MQLPVFSTIPRLSIEDVSMNDQSSDQPFNHRMIITGDFNYSPSFSSQYTNSTPQIPFRAAQRDWHDFLLTNFNEFTHPSLDNPLPTFRRGTTSSTIDYIFGSLSLFPCVQKSNTEFINSKWTDHALLSIQFKFGSGRHGKGLWRANPYLATNSYFVKTLYRSLDWFCSSRVTPPFDIDSDLRPSPVETPRSLWEAVKVEVKRVARSFGRKQASWQQLHLSRLQAKRDRLLSSQSPTSGLHPSLTRTEKLIGHLQTDIQWPSKLVACFHILPIHVADYFVS